MHALATQPFLNCAFTFGNSPHNAGRLLFCAGYPKGAPSNTASAHLSGVPFMDSIWQFFREDDGQDVVEYGLLIATIAIVVLIGVGIFGGNINTWFKNLAARITTVGT